MMLLHAVCTCRMLLQQTYSPVTSFSRQLFKDTKVWENTYKKTNRIEIEKYWTKKLAERMENKKLDTKAEENKEKFYCLSMFPYPSGSLHMGHVRVYTISDVMSHYHRMRGKHVIHPMGWDSFGLPAENAAIHRGLDPAEWTNKNIAAMKEQLMELNLFFDWDREVSTCNPDYYKWTQYLFVKMFKAGLAYKAEAAVNWDPVDKTVLADEQSLLDTMDEMEEHVGIKGLQRNWIGKVDGVEINLKIKIADVITDVELPTYCSHPELLSHATHINLNSIRREDFLHRITLAGGCNISLPHPHQELTETPLPGVTVINPFTSDELPLIFTNHIRRYQRARAAVGIPEVCEIEAEVAMKNKLKASQQHLHMSRDDALEELKMIGCSTCQPISLELADWLISRQRRWGTPIPAINCPRCGPVIVDESQLPVTMPATGTPLDEWKLTTCPSCGDEAERETDTMDTFVDSSWYFLRYTDPHNKNEPFSKELCDEMMPIDLYIGGIEHAVLHLVFARFFNHFCCDQGMLEHREPFKKILAQGLIKGQTFRLKEGGQYLSPEQVQHKDGMYMEIGTGNPVDVTFEKMSKSKFNGVDPASFVADWGISLTRLFVLYSAAPEEDINWDVNSDVIPGSKRWQMKMWKMVGQLIKYRNETEHWTNEELELNEDEKDEEAEFVEKLNECITKVTRLMENATTLNTALAQLMGFSNVIMNSTEGLKKKSSYYEDGVCAQVIMAAPMIPQYTSELWQGLKGMKYKMTRQNWKGEILDQSWPVNLSYHLQPRPKWHIKVNKRICGFVRISNHVTDMELILEQALKHKQVVKQLNGYDVTRKFVRNNLIILLTNEPKKKRVKRVFEKKK